MNALVCYAKRNCFSLGRLIMNCSREQFYLGKVRLPFQNQVQQHSSLISQMEFLN